HAVGLVDDRLEPLRHGLQYRRCAHAGRALVPWIKGARLISSTRWLVYSLANGDLRGPAQILASVRREGGGDGLRRSLGERVQRLDEPVDPRRHHEQVTGRFHA